MLAWSLLSLFAIPTLAVPSNDQHVEPRKNHLVKRSPRSGAGDLDKPTTFNGIVVPPMKTLTPDNFEETVKDGYWSVSLVLSATPVVSFDRHLTVTRFIKFYSPACPHCTKIAPAWQTLYEYYYVSVKDPFLVALYLTLSRRPILCPRLPRNRSTPSR